LALKTLFFLQIDSGVIRPVSHFQFVSWPDYGVPDSALSMLHFLQRVREKQVEMRLANLSPEELVPIK
jgi:tyrosine-protein phosphatase non-receptor type 9